MTQSASALPPDLFTLLQALDSCSMCNAIEATGVRLRDEGFSNGSVRSLFPALAPMLAYAFTLRVSTGHPKVRGVRYVDHIDWAAQLLALPDPRVLVIENVGAEPLCGAVLGEVHASIYRALGVVGVITNGAVRDLPELEAMRFQAFASGVSVSHAYAHVVEAGAPVSLAGMRIQTGDILHGDVHGIVSVPADIAHRLPGLVQQQKTDEAVIIDYCRSARFSLAGIDALLQQVQRDHPLPD